MSETEQLDFDSDDQYQPLTSAIARLSTLDDSETLEETVTRTEQLEQAAKQSGNPEESVSKEFSARIL